MAHGGEEPYGSVEEIRRRAGITASMLERLAEADAFSGIGLDRRQALWAVRRLADAVLPCSPRQHGSGSPRLQIADPNEGSRLALVASSGIAGGPWVAAMGDLVAGERIGGFVLLVDEDGLRHAVRCGAVLALSDGDGMGSDTLMQLPGGRTVTIRRPVSEVVRWFR